MHKVAEKRKYKRIEIPYMTRFRIKQHETQDIVSNDWDAVCLNNLGAGGIFFYTKRSLEIGTILDLRICFSTYITSTKCVGRVVRKKRHLDTFIFGIGIKFTEIDEHIREMLSKISLFVKPEIQFSFNKG